MPCAEDTPKEIDVAIQILDIVTPRINLGSDVDNTVTREISQTDHLNKRLLKTFLERLNITNETPINNNAEEDDNYQDFDE